MVSTGTEVMSTASRGDCTCKVVRFAAETTHPRFPATPLKDIKPSSWVTCGRYLSRKVLIRTMRISGRFGVVLCKCVSGFLERPIMNYCDELLWMFTTTVGLNIFSHELIDLGTSAFSGCFFFLIYFLMGAPSFNSWSNTHSLSSDNAMQACHHTTRLQWIVQCWTTWRNLGFYIFLRYDLPLSWMVFQICSSNIIFVYLSSLYFSYPFFWTTIIEIFGQRSSELYLTVTAGGER